MRFEDQRELLVKELVSKGITSSVIIEAIKAIPREKFIPPDLLAYAYHNRPLPIGNNQTISQPLIIATMLQYLDIAKSDLVLEIGTGSGYQTALLAFLAKEVCTVERIETLSLSARTTVKKIGFTNVHYRIGDGAKGWENAYPAYKSFNKIIVSAGASGIPQRLTDQIADGGMLIVPVGDRESQTLVRITKNGDQLVKDELDACAFVPLITNEIQESVL